MADKSVTVSVPEERVPEFYAWFARFLASEPSAEGGGRHGPGHRGPGEGARFGRGRFGGDRWGGGPPDDPVGWTKDDAEEAAWLYGKLAPPARKLVDLLVQAPGTRIPGNELAAQLGLEKGAHGVAGILAWPGRYSRRLGRQMPILTEGRADGGTDYYMAPDVAALFAAAAAGPAPEPAPE